MAIDVTAYPTTANVEKTITFTCKTTGDDDIQFKTSGSSGMIISKLVFYGMGSRIENVIEVYKPFFDINSRRISSEELLNITNISGKVIAKNTYHINLNPGIYIVKSGFKTMKIIIH